jgi:hypothetical protein
MKKLVALLACTVIASSAFAQGTINFTNMKPTKQIISDAAGAKLEGAWAQLYAGTSADSLSAVGAPVAFYEGTKAGYFKGGVVDVGFNGAEVDFSKCISTCIGHWCRAAIYANVIITLNHSCDP